jgi:hypothetical protein
MGFPAHLRHQVTLVIHYGENELRITIGAPTVIFSGLPGDQAVGIKSNLKFLVYMGYILRS